MINSVRQRNLEWIKRETECVGILRFALRKDPNDFEVE